MMKRYYLLFAVLFSSSALMAQTTDIQLDTIQWNATGFTDLISNTKANVPCYFITDGTHRVDWVQSNGAFITTFNATKIAGTWTNPNSDGTLTLAISFEALTGQLILSKSGSSTTIKLILNGGSDAIENSYTISSIEKL